MRDRQRQGPAADALVGRAGVPDLAGVPAATAGGRARPAAAVPAGRGSPLRAEARTANGENRDRDGDRPGTSGIQAPEGDVASIPRSVRGRGAVQSATPPSICPAAEGAVRSIRRAAAPGVLRELRRIDHRLVRGDAVPARAGPDASKDTTRRPRQFFSAFSEDCDLKGTSAERFLPPAVDRGAGGGSELRPGGLSAHRAKRGRTGRGGAAGARRGLTWCEYRPEDLINWS